MKAMQLTAWKTPPQIREVPEPEAGPGQVVIRVAGAGACHSDLHLLHDFEAGMMPWNPPFTLGHENAGWVHTIGAGVSGLQVGEPVAVYGPWGCGRCKRCQVGMENYCERAADQPAAGGGLGYDGGMAQYMLVPAARLLVPLGDLDPVDAAPLTDAALTPYHAVKRSLPLLTPGATAVAIGIGGLGHMGVQILRALTAARIIAVDTRPEALRLAEQSGADHAVRSGADAADEIRELTEGRGADVVVDFVGVDATMALATAVARPLSDITVVGIGGGSVPFGFFSVPYEARLATTYWGSRPELMEVLDLARQGRIKTVVHRFTLDEAPMVYERLAAGEFTGRAVITPNA
ncbi:oxidoreductase [Mycolicibacterium doricum]|uniref:alcohol dehydrogenase n=1 Tax=Mycolicibacterium doricum TaxID=126673 RepID=A0A1X1T730_9MYCO|nr:NAD(P)-dependent alcohol dehydrogenase [Mycolicibacterium doricum]MCV7267140.1 NAD(P)-dependent alcohol dehydrogenase [Mycolicibacterium doricum]ORV40342.1 alcohol dehydrogenase [Mycolicibacterium doricum]BBZ08342.1 oxidoreductase [Mycolicibacterium doricum]